MVLFKQNGGWGDGPFVACLRKLIRTIGDQSVDVFSEGFPDSTNQNEFVSVIKPNSANNARKISRTSAEIQYALRIYFVAASISAICCL